MILTFWLFLPETIVTPVFLFLLIPKFYGSADGQYLISHVLTVVVTGKG